MANLADQKLLALIVDRYLHDNNFLKTRNSFRNEASFLFNDSPKTNQMSMNLMGLDEILNELKLLKELMLQVRFLMKLERVCTQKLLQRMQCVINVYYDHSGTLPVTNLPVPPVPLKANSAVVPTGVTTPPGFLAPQSINTNARTGNVSTPVMLDQERFLREREKYQTQLLLFRMQDLINTYNGNRTQPRFLNPNFPVVPPPPNAYSAVPVVPQPKLGNRTPTGVTTPSARFLVPQSIITDATTITTTQKTSNVLSAPPSINAENGNFSTFVMMSVSNRKRKDIEAMDATSIGKKSRGRSSSGKIPVQDQNTSPQSNNVINKQTVSQPSSVVPQPKLGNRTPAGVNTTTVPPTGFLVPQSINTDTTTGNVSTPVMSVSNRKRKETEATDAPSSGNKSRDRSSSGKIPVQDQNALPQSNNVVNKQTVSQPSSETQSVAGNFVPSGSQVQDSSVAKCFFNPPLVSIPINSPIPKTPTRTTSCQRDTDISVIDNPPEQVDYIKSSHCISPVKTDSNKGNGLGFDASDMLESSDKPLSNEISTHASDKQNDLPEFANLTYDDNYDDLWANIPFTDLPADFPFNDDDLETFADLYNDPDSPWEGFDFLDHPTHNHLKDNASSPSHECKSQQVISELPSTAAKVLSEKDVNVQGLDSLTAMESFKKRTTNLNSNRNRQHSFGKENC